MALTLRLFRYTMVACGPVMFLGAVFLGVRLAPLHFRHGVAIGTLWPLAASGLATTFEAALLIGIPAGFALAANKPPAAVQPGPAGRSVSRARWHVETAGFAAMLLVVTAAIGVYANLRLTRPGRIARGIVQSARQFCEQSNGRAPIPLPTVRARWVCSPGSPPRLVGEFARSGITANYSAQQVEVSEDLSYIELADFELATMARQGRPSLRLVTSSARLSGIGAWSTTQRFTGVGRAVYVATVGTLFGLFAALLARKGPGRSRWLGAAAAGLAGFGTWLMLRLVDSHPRWTGLSYALVPVGVALAMVGLWIAFSATWPAARIGRS